MSEFPTIESFIPKLLDEIIREHRDEFSLRLSTAEDFAALPPMVSSIGHQKMVRATINEWRIVCLVRSAGLGGNLLILTGIHQAQDCVWYTSPIVSADFENNFVFTENSLYRLGSKGEGEPDLSIILHICSCLHSWGIGAHLGVLQVFY
jgi:hypothetical protein